MEDVSARGTNPGITTSVTLEQVRAKQGWEEFFSTTRSFRLRERDQNDRDTGIETGISVYFHLETKEAKTTVLRYSEHI